MLEVVEAGLREAQRALDDLCADRVMLQTIASAGLALSAALNDGRRVHSCGNGGSMCDAMHFAEELSGRYRDDRPALAAAAISDVAHMTCVANDYGYEHVFSRYIEAHGRAGDFLLAISTSGKSRSILNAAEAARARGVKVIAMHGRRGSPLEALADYNICTPGGQYADRVQELHIKVVHMLIEIVERALFPGNYR
jgi:D-sedoheptulose 7-phosphate isomerase